MKKSIVIVLVVVGIVFVGIVGLIVFGVLSLAKPREALTVKEFENIMEAKEFNIIDVKDQFSDTPYLETAL